MTRTFGKHASKSVFDVDYDDGGSDKIILGALSE
jgi:hypothetical protein